MQLDPTTDSAFLQFLPGQPQEDDKALVVRFFVGKKLLGARSQAEGREIFEDREFIEIKIKGQDKQVVVEEVSQKHKQRFPIAYHQFLTQKPAPVVGTPIEQLSGVGPSLAHNLRGLNIRTIEDLAQITDESALQSIGMGARDLVKRAQAWLANSTENELRLQKENVELRQIVADMNDRLKTVEGKPAKKAKKRPAKRAEPQQAPA